MTITRVIRDNVEFFTIDDTGESGMSQSALARLCGVSQQGVNKILHKMAETHQADGANAELRKEIWLQERMLSGLRDSKISNLCIVKGL